MDNCGRIYLERTCILTAMSSANDAEKKEVLFVRILALGEVIWEGEANSLSAENMEGSFDILPQHANFISILTDAPIVVRTDDEEKSFSFKRALLYANKKKIKVYVGV